MPQSRTLLTRPIGETGLKGSPTGMLFEEFLPALRGTPGMRKFKEMADNDPVIGGFLYATSMLLRSVDWSVRAADESAAAEEAKEFVEQVLFEDMATPFPDVIEEALSMLVYGFAPLEIVYKKRGGMPLAAMLGAARMGQDDSGAVLEQGAPAKVPGSRFDDGMLGVHKIALRSQDSVYRWFFDEYGELTGLEQQRQAKRSVKIPREKFLLFRTVAFKNNPEGRSLLRGAYVSVERKKALEIAEGRLALRSAGIVLLRVPEELLDPQADEETKVVLASYKAIADALAQDRQGVVMLPSKMSDGDGAKAPLYDVSYVTADGRRPSDIGSMIERLDKRIAGSVLADFLMLGSEKGGGGSFALSKDKTELFTLALYGYLQSIAAEFNRHLIPKLWALNGLDESVMPTLEYGEVEQANLAEVGTFLQTLSGAGATLFPNKPLTDALMAMADLPPVPDELEDMALETAENALAAGAVLAEGGMDGGEGDGGEMEDDDAEAVDLDEEDAVEKDSAASRRAWESRRNSQGRSRDVAEAEGKATRGGHATHEVGTRGSILTRVAGMTNARGEEGVFARVRLTGDGRSTGGTGLHSALMRVASRGGSTRVSVRGHSVRVGFDAKTRTAIIQHPDGTVLRSRAGVSSDEARSSLRAGLSAMGING